MFKLLKRFKNSIFFIYLFDLLFFIGLVMCKMYLADFYPILNNFYFMFGSFLLIAIFPLLICTIFSYKFEVKYRRNYIRVANTLGAEYTEAFDFAEFGLLSYNDNNEIVWVSDIFEHRNISLLGHFINDEFENADKLINNEIQYINKTINNRIYKIMCISELNVLVFKDVTDVNDLNESISDNSPVICEILLDNLEQVVDNLDEDDFNSLELDVRRVILDWAKKNDYLLRKVRHDTYLCIIKESDYQDIKKNNFEIVDKVREVSKDEEFTLTISLGFGRGIYDYNKLADLASDAVSISQSRGGSQAVVSNFAGHSEFYGAGLNNTASISNVKIRTFAESLKSHILAHNNFYIVPHQDADFDAIGACLGIKQFINKYGKNAYIVADEKQIELKTRIMFKDLIGTEDLISPSKIKNENNEETLVIVCDVHRPILTTAPKLIEKSKHIAVIDHHRRSEDAIDNPIYSFISTNSSSTCEIVLGLLKNCPDPITIDSDIATIMYAGILLDTKQFKTRTSSLTFKAAMELKDCGANIKVANSYLQDEMEEFELKTRIVSNFKSPTLGVVVSIVPDDDYVDRTMLAKAAEELLNIKDVRASFVIGYLEKNKVGISGRSDNTVNIQYILEKMGGGGHSNSGAAQIDNISIEEAQKQLDELLKEYVDY